MIARSALRGSLVAAAKAPSRSKPSTVDQHRLEGGLSQQTHEGRLRHALTERIGGQKIGESLIPGHGLKCRVIRQVGKRIGSGEIIESVSYTHLTLPTIYSV